LIAYAFVVIFITIRLSPADFWVTVKDGDGNNFNMDFAFSKIFGQGQRIIIGSLTAFLLGQLVDVFVFQQLRKVTGSKKLWLRATGSTLVSQFIDSFVVLFIAFYGVFTNQQIIAIGITNYIYKFTVAIVLTPLIYLGHAWIDRLSRERSKLRRSRLRPQNRARGSFKFRVSSFGFLVVRLTACRFLEFFSGFEFRVGTAQPAHSERRKLETINSKLETK
jgi:uncharacterized integral membrane protein (TIGR00697 family)